jgi:hypothetical protein
VQRIGRTFHLLGRINDCVFIVDSGRKPIMLASTIKIVSHPLCNREVPAMPAFPLRLMICAAMLAGTAPASAVVRTAVFTGEVTSGYDLTGLFGVISNDLTGVAFRATYTYESTRGGQVITASSEERSGGGNFPLLLIPILDSTVTINGITIHTNPVTVGRASTSDFFQIFDTQELVSTPTGIFNRVTNHSALAVAGPTRLAGTYAQQAAIVGGNFSSYAAPAGGPATESVSLQMGGLGTYEVFGAVPEPANWAMLITGFGLTGAILRRRRLRLA